MLQSVVFTGLPRSKSLGLQRASLRAPCHAVRIAFIDLIATT